MGLFSKSSSKSSGGEGDDSFLGLTRMVIGGVVVALALGALVLSVHFVLDVYQVEGVTPSAGAAESGERVATDTASVSASSVVAVITPVLAGIVGIAGLFFGLSATGSARGTQAETEKINAETNATTAEAIKIQAKTTSTESSATALPPAKSDTDSDPPSP